MTIDRIEVSPQAQMLAMIGGFWVARSLDLAAEIGVADGFDGEPKTISQLAAATDTEPRSRIACSVPLRGWVCWQKLPIKRLRSRR